MEVCIVQAASGV